MQPCMSRARTAISRPQRRFTRDTGITRSLAFCNAADRMPGCWRPVEQPAIPYTLQTMNVADFKTELVSLLPRLRRFAVGLTGNVDKADELVQAGCLKALERSAQWQPGTSLASWMFRILQTTWIDERRTLERRNTVADTDAIERYSGDDDASRHAARDTLRDVEREIASLPEDQRAVLLLVCVEGLSYKEAAEVLGLPIGTVMSRLARARGRLADALQVHEE